MLQMEEQRRRQDEERLKKEKDRISRYMTEQEPVFAQLYINIQEATGVM